MSPPDPRPIKSSSRKPTNKRMEGLGLSILYVQEVVTLHKKIFNIFASENEVYTIY